MTHIEKILSFRNRLMNERLEQEGSKRDFFQII